MRAGAQAHQPITAKRLHVAHRRTSTPVRPNLPQQTYSASLTSAHARRRASTPNYYRHTTHCRSPARKRAGAQAHRTTTANALSVTDQRARAPARKRTKPLPPNDSMLLAELLLQVGHTLTAKPLPPNYSVLITSRQALFHPHHRRRALDGAGARRRVSVQRSLTARAHTSASYMSS